MFGIRLNQSIWLSLQLFGKKVKVLGADGIYATNANRNDVPQCGIKTDFKIKGSFSKHKKQSGRLAATITKERATRLEGSFGTEKELCSETDTSKNKGQ